MMMGLLSKNSLLVSTLLAAAAVRNVGAFTVSQRTVVAPRAQQSQSRPAAALFMAKEGGDDGTLITSGRKEIGYDEESGRFFETGLEEEDCIPDEEYCVVDKGSGKLIRLTTAEKERIFLDSLQVTTSFHSLLSQEFRGVVFAKRRCVSHLCVRVPCSFPIVGLLL